MAESPSIYINMIIFLKYYRQLLFFNYAIEAKITVKVCKFLYKSRYYIIINKKGYQNTGK